MNSIILLTVVFTFTIGFSSGYGARYLHEQPHAASVSVQTPMTQPTAVSSFTRNDYATQQTQNRAAPTPRAAALALTRQQTIADERSGNQSQVALSSSDYAAQLDKLVNDPDSLDTMARLLNQWARSYGQDAFEWVSSRGFSAEHENLYFDVLLTFMDNNPSAAGEALLSISDPESRAYLMPEYVYLLGDKDPVKALEWTNNIVDTDVRQDSLGVLFDSWSGSEPLQALEYLSLLPTEDVLLLMESARQAAWHASEEDPLNVSYAVFQYPAELQTEVAYSLVGAWLEIDVDGAVSWVQSLPGGTLKDNAIKSYIQYSDSNNRSALGFDLAASISDPDERIAAVAQVYREWLNSDPLSAGFALETEPNLDNAQKASIASASDRNLC